MEHIELEPCPCCKGEVELTTSRDLNVFETYVNCLDCDICFFVCETLANFDTPGSAEEEELCDKLVSMTYNRFCKTNPTNYKDFIFSKCAHDKNYFGKG